MFCGIWQCWGASATLSWFAVHWWSPRHSVLSPVHSYQKQDSAGLAVNRVINIMMGLVVSQPPQVSTFWTAIACFYPVLTLRAHLTSKTYIETKSCYIWVVCIRTMSVLKAVQHNRLPTQTGLSKTNSPSSYSKKKSVKSNKMWFVALQW